MKPAEVELRTEPLLRAASQREQALLAHLVGERLPGPGDVAVHLELDLGVGERAVVAQTSDRLVPRPAHRVHASVDHQPAGAPHLERQPAKALIGVAIDPHVLAELFGIESPAFDVRGYVVVAAELRQVCQLLAERDLEVVPRYAFVQHPGGQPV